MVSKTCVGVSTTQPMAWSALCMLTLIISRGCGGIASPGINEYLRNRGIDESAMGALISATTAIAALLAIPVGLWVDKKGCKPLLVSGLCSSLFASLAYIFAGNFAVLILGRAFEGASYALLGVSSLSFLRRSVEAGPCKTGADAWERWALAGSSLACALSNVLGGVLSTIDDRLPFIIMASMSLTQLLVVASLKEPPRHVGGSVGLLSACRHCFRRKSSQRWILLALSALSAMFGAVGFFYEPCFKAAGFSGSAFGVIMASYEVLGALSLAFAGFIRGGKILPRMFYGCTLTAAVAYPLLGTCPAVVALVVGALFPILRSSFMVVFMNALRSRTPEELRSTVMSLQGSFAGMLGFAVNLPLGVGVQLFGLSVALYLVAALCVLAMVGLLAVRCEE